MTTATAPVVDGGKPTAPATETKTTLVTETPKAPPQTEAAKAPETKEASTLIAAPVKEAEKKPEEGAKAPVPEKYDLKLSETAKMVDPGLLERTATIARELGLDNKAAQKALDLVSSEVMGHFQKLQEESKPNGELWNSRVTEWEKAALADKEIGGTPENLKASAELGRRALEKFFPETFRQVLFETGWGSHPDVVKGLARIGKAMKDDKAIKGGNPPGAAPKTPAEILFGDMAQGKQTGE